MMKIVVNNFQIANIISCSRTITVLYEKLKRTELDN